RRSAERRRAERRRAGWARARRGDARPARRRLMDTPEAGGEGGAGPIRLILWRHGQTAWNVTGRVQGQTDVDLDETGVAQAAATAPRVAQYRPDLIVSSDLRRAARTAAALADVTGLPVEYDARLRER